MQKEIFLKQYFAIVYKSSQYKWCTAVRPRTSQCLGLKDKVKTMSFTQKKNNSH